MGECSGAGPAVIAAMTKAAMNGSEKDGNGVYGSRGEQVHSFYFILWLHADLIRPFSTFSSNAPQYFALTRPFSTFFDPPPPKAVTRPTSALEA